MSYNYFNVSEFGCNCNNCENKNTGFNMNKSFIELLDQARDIAGIPFKITSGFRCEEWNLNTGGRIGSSHCKGLAVDIKFNGSRDCFLIVNALLKVGINRIGISKERSFIHCDVDIIKDANVLWLY